MVMISSIEEVAQVVLQVHHQHRLRGWTLSAELGAPPVHAWSRVSRDRCDSWVLWVHGHPGITSQNRRVGPRDGERVPEHPVPKVNVLSASCTTYGESQPAPSQV